MSNSTSSSKESLLKDYIVVKEPENGNLLITHRSNFVEQDDCKCYNHFGIINDCNTAGCYSFSNTDSAIYDDFKCAVQKISKDAINSDCSTKELVECLQNNNQPDHIDTETFLKIKECYTQFLTKENHIKIVAYTFFDGSNWKSLTLFSEYYNETDLVELPEKDQIEIISEMPENPEMNQPTVYVETENYVFQYSRHTSYPWICEVGVQ